MPKVRDVLKHVSIETAIRRRICHRRRDEHWIEKGENCLVIKDVATGGKKNYCAECAPEILNLAEGQIKKFRSELH